MKPALRSLSKAVALLVLCAPSTAAASRPTAGSTSLAPGGRASQDGPAGPAAGQEVRYGRAKQDGVALRNLGDVNGHTVTELKQGALLSIHRENAGWLQVEVPGGMPVWVFGKFLAETGTPGVLEVTGNGVNLRPRAAGGSANYPLGKLYAGDQVEVLARADAALPLAEDWVQIWSPPGIRAWVRSEEVAALKTTENGAELWRAELGALAGTARKPEGARTPAPKTGSGGQAKPAAQVAAQAPARPDPKQQAMEQAMERYDAAAALLTAQRQAGTVDYVGLRAEFEGVQRTVPGSPAAKQATERLEVLGLLEKAAKVQADLNDERERRGREVLERQEQAWEVARKKDPLGQRFASRGMLERREFVGAAPRYFLRFGGEDVCEVVCTRGRYDLDLYSGHDLGVQGDFLRAAPVEAGSGSAPLAVLDAERVRVLARRR